MKSNAAWKNSFSRPASLSFRGSVMTQSETTFAVLLGTASASATLVRMNPIGSARSNRL